MRARDHRSEGARHPLSRVGVREKIHHVRRVSVGGRGAGNNARLSARPPAPRFAGPAKNPFGWRLRFRPPRANPLNARPNRDPRPPPLPCCRAGNAGPEGRSFRAGRKAGRPWEVPESRGRAGSPEPRFSPLPRPGATVDARSLSTPGARGVRDHPRRLYGLGFAARLATCWIPRCGYGGSTVEVCTVYGGSTVEVAWRYGGSTVEVAWRYGGSTVEVCTVYGGSTVEVCTKYG